MQPRRLSPTAVVTCAAELADEEGLDRVTLSAVARRLGVQTPSLYGHVRDLRALHDGIVALALDDLSDRVGTATQGRAGREALGALADAHRRYASDHTGRWDALQRPSGPDAAASPAASRIAQTILAVLHGYEIREDRLVDAVRIVAAGVNGFVQLERIGSLGHRDRSLDASWIAMLDGLDLVLSSWAGR